MKNKRLLEPQDVDQLGQALVTLTQELWVLKDRQRILEAMLEDAGLLDRAKLETREPDTALAEELDEQRRALIDNVLGALSAPSADRRDR